MIDQTAFFSLSYGLYIVAAKADGRAAGCVVNTFQQVTSSPLQVSVALNKENATTAAVRAAGRLTAACLSRDATMELIGTFGFHCSNDRDKFAACKADFDAEGVPYVAEQACARFSARVVQEIDLGTHVLFVGEVEEAERLGAGEPMTYAYYHQVKGGKTPPKASSYVPDAAPAPVSAMSADAAPASVSSAEAPDAAAAEPPATAASDAAAQGGSAQKAAPRYAWRCKVCGHIEYADELPDDFTCPVCMVGKDMFERVEL